MKIKKLEQNTEKFMEVAKRLVDISNRCDEEDSVKESLSEFIALNMAMGEQLTMKKYLVTGGMIGVASTALAFGVYKKFKKRRDTEEVGVTLDLELFEGMLQDNVIELKKHQVEG